MSSELSTEPNIIFSSNFIHSVNVFCLSDPCCSVGGTAFDRVHWEQDCIDPVISCSLQSFNNDCLVAGENTYSHRLCLFCVKKKFSFFFIINSPIFSQILIIVDCKRHIMEPLLPIASTWLSKSWPPRTCLIHSLVLCAFVSPLFFLCVFVFSRETRRRKRCGLGLWVVAW